MAWLPWLRLSLIGAALTVVHSTDLKALDDGVLFAVKWPGSFSDDIIKEMEPGAEIIDMNSAEGEKYKCVIPPMGTTTEIDRQEYTGPNALELLEPLIQQTSCSFRLESYWTYEVCHGKYVRQYHQETGRSPKLQEYYLGKWDGDQFKKEVAKLAEKKPGPLPTKKIDGLNMPYVEINMTDGTMCDLSNTPRSVRVLYICYRQGKHEVYSLEETRTCEYEVIVLSPLLCAHPDYRVRDQLHNDISCYAEDGVNRRPRTLRDMEAESLKLRHQTTILELTTGPGKKYTVEINPVDIQEVLDQADKHTLDLELGKLGLTPGKDEKFGLKSSLPAVKSRLPSYDAKLVEDFLAGSYCLHGGTGWWKYEFCYGKKVLQYHAEPDGTKTTILLGMFDKDEHISWLARNPQKKPASGQKKSVSHYYTGGSLCDLTNKPRHVEVKLKCRESAGSSESLNAVSLYLLEPEVCSYILGVESPILCHILDTADENGFMTLPPAQASIMAAQPTVKEPEGGSNLAEDVAAAHPMLKEFEDGSDLAEDVAVPETMKSAIPEQMSLQDPVVVEAEINQEENELKTEQEEAPSEDGNN